MKKFFQEFKEFASQGNMFDMAIGIIIGGAFTTIVTSLVDDLINPILGIFTGGIDFSELYIALDGNEYSSLAAAEEAGANVFKYGSFISAVINFIIMALIVFILVKIISKLTAPMKKEEAPTTKQCPYCMSEIDIMATRCPNCTSMVEVDPELLKAAEEAAKAEAEAAETEAK